MSVTVIHKCDNPDCPNKSETQDVNADKWVIADIRVADHLPRFRPLITDSSALVFCTWFCLAGWALGFAKSKAAKS